MECFKQNTIKHWHGGSAARKINYRDLNIKVNAQGKKITLPMQVFSKGGGRLCNMRVYNYDDDAKNPLIPTGIEIFQSQHQGYIVLV